MINGVKISNRNQRVTGLPMKPRITQPTVFLNKALAGIGISVDIHEMPGQPTTLNLHRIPARGLDDSSSGLW